LVLTVLLALMNLIVAQISSSIAIHPSLNSSTLSALPQPRRFTDHFLASVKGLKAEEGLIIDFFGWTESWELAYFSKQRSSKLFQVSGAKHAIVEPEALRAFLAKFPRGKLVLRPTRRLLEALRTMESLCLERANTAPAPSLQTFSVYAYDTRIRQDSSVCADLGSLG
jgi:hypothetical protein